MSQMLEPDLSVVDLRSYFVRKRNALLVRGRFSPLYLDYYLHLMQYGLQNAEPLDQITELDGKRRLIGIVALVIFIITFSPIPLVLF